MNSSSASERFSNVRSGNSLGLNRDLHLNATTKGEANAWLVMYGDPKQLDPNDSATWQSGIGVTTNTDHGEKAIEKGFQTVEYFFDGDTAQDKANVEAEKLAWLENIAEQCKNEPKEFGQWVSHTWTGNRVGTSLYLLLALGLRPDSEVKVNNVPAESPGSSRVPFTNADVEYIMGLWKPDRLNDCKPIEQPYDWQGKVWVVQYRAAPVVLNGLYDSGLGVTSDKSVVMKLCDEPMISGDGKVKIIAYDPQPGGGNWGDVPFQLNLMALECNIADGIMFGSRQFQNKLDEDQGRFIWYSQNLTPLLEKTAKKADVIAAESLLGLASASSA